MIDNYEMDLLVVRVTVTVTHSWKIRISLNIISM